MQNLEDNNHDKIEAVDLQVEMARSYLDYAILSFQRQKGLVEVSLH